VAKVIVSAACENRRTELAAFVIAMGAVMIQIETAELEKRFGELYAAYRERVPPVLPRVRGYPFAVH